MSFEQRPCCSQQFATAVPSPASPSAAGVHTSGVGAHEGKIRIAQIVAGNHSHYP
jgi:hypothetical protein